MSRRAPFRQVDVARAVRGALKAGLPAGSFSVEIQEGAIRLLPIAANTPLDAASEDERRMRDAFGE